MTIQAQIFNAKFKSNNQKIAFFRIILLPNFAPINGLNYEWNV